MDIRLTDPSHPAPRSPPVVLAHRGQAAFPALVPSQMGRVLQALGERRRAAG